jgi:hypothetical protein
MPWRSRLKWGAEGKPEYAIAGSYGEFVEWLRHYARTDVCYLTKERAELYLARGAPKGVLHRIGNWQKSPARVAAEALEKSSEELENGMEER